MLVMDEKAKHEALMAKIANGEKIESSEEMTAEYRDALLLLMIAQADSELAGAYGYVPWIEGAPTNAEKLAMANIVKDEIRHAKAMYDLLDRLEVDTDKLINQDHMKHRMKVFYEPIKTWADLVMFNFLMDRAAATSCAMLLSPATAPGREPWCRSRKKNGCMFATAKPG